MKVRLFSTLICALAIAMPAIAQPQQNSAREQERITKEVRHELLMLPYFGVFDNITYKVDGPQRHFSARSCGRC